MVLGIEPGRLGGSAGTLAAQDAPRRLDGASGKAGGGSFAESLKAALGETAAALREGDAAALRLATGEATSLHEVVLATERANLALQFTMALRNKVLEAYNELMRMPV